MGQARHGRGRSGLKQGEKSGRISFSLFYYLFFFGFGGFFPLLSVYFKNEVGLSGGNRDHSGNRTHRDDAGSALLGDDL